MDLFASYSDVDFADKEPTVASKEKAVAAMNHRLPTFDYDSLTYGMRPAPLAVKGMAGKSIPNALKEKESVGVSVSLQVVRSASAAASAASSSPCPEKPVYLTRFHAYAQQRDFSSLCGVLAQAVASLDSEHLDADFDKDACMWRMKYFYGADMRELHLCVYWDSQREDHCVELLRVNDSGRTHAQSPSTHDLFARIRNALSPSPQSSQTHTVNGDNNNTQAKRMRCCLPAPPLVLVASSSAKENVNVNNNNINSEMPPAVDAALPPLPPPPARLSRSSTSSGGFGASLSLVPPPPPPSLSVSRSLSVSAAVNTAAAVPSSSAWASLAVPATVTPSLSTSVESEWAVRTTEEEFLSGVRQLTALRTDAHYETRRECARALCVLAQKHAQRSTPSSVFGNHEQEQGGDEVERALLCLPQCVAEIVDALCDLLCDEWEEVVELAVMAVSLFVDMDDEYMAALGAQPRAIERLLDLTLDLADVTTLSYKTAMGRRRAALSLSLLVQHDNARLCVCEAMKVRGFASMVAWNSECVSRIADERGQRFAKQVLYCF